MDSVLVSGCLACSALFPLQFDFSYLCFFTGPNFGAWALSLLALPLFLIVEEHKEQQEHTHRDTKWPRFFPPILGKDWSKIQHG